MINGVLGGSPFATANGPPPGLAAPPGLVHNRAAYGGNLISHAPLFLKQGIEPQTVVPSGNGSSQQHSELEMPLLSTPAHEWFIPAPTRDYNGDILDSTALQQARAAYIREAGVPDEKGDIVRRHSQENPVLLQQTLDLNAIIEDDAIIENEAPVESAFVQPLNSSSGTLILGLGLGWWNGGAVERNSSQLEEGEYEVEITLNDLQQDASVDNPRLKEQAFVNSLGMDKNMSHAELEIHLGPMLEVYMNEKADGARETQLNGEGHKRNVVLATDGGNMMNNPTGTGGNHYAGNGYTAPATKSPVEQ